ncbi:MAG TPA: PilN domain-containing protein [Pyrinomonadaceae bacterium]|jgi:Tfp pilus assembly protein PilN
MIKINLLNSVTERQGGAVVAVDRKISSPMSRLLIMSLAVGFLFLVVVGFDIISSQRQKNQAEADLVEQKQIATELEAVLKEQKELETKIKNIDTRIEAIKKLRASQAGPSAVLEALRERIAMVPGLYLESVEQTGDQLTIKGNSPDEQAVTQFGRSLEFSGGLFSNLSIETQRKEEQNQQAAATTNPQSSDASKLVLVGFSIRCAYTPSKANSGNGSSAATTAQNTQPSAAVPNKPENPQIAKNQ